MDKFLTKDKVAVIIQNAPEGTKPEDVVNGLVSRGYKLEGFNDQPEPKKPMTGSDKATFQATGNEGIVGGTLKAIGNVPSSAIEMGKNIKDVVTNPVQTVKTVGNIVKGIGAKAGELALENTDFGQQFLAKANEKRIASGQTPLQQVNGKFQVENTPELDTLNQVGQFFKDRYGSLDKFKETAIEDPVGVLADVATIFTAGGAGASKIGQISKVGEVSKVGQVLTKAGQTLEPVNAVSKGTSKISKTAKETTPGRIVSEIVPTTTDMQRNQVVKALDLTQGDLASIGKKTGNDVTDFIVSKNLLKETPEAVADSLNEFRKTAKAEKANVISQVTNIYTPDQVPSIIKGLDTILADVDGVAGLENVASEIKTLRNKTQFTLEDIQNAQYLLDDNSSIYSKIGDAKSTSKAKGLDNIRKDIRSFIENEVDTATNGQTNIRQLNNEIQTSYAIEDAINTRATRNLTRQKLSLGDSVVLFGGGATFNPAVGIGLYLGKKIIETPSFRLAFTKALNAKPVAQVKKLVNEIKTKNVSPEIQKMINELAKEARKNLQVVESGSAIVEKSKSKQ